MQGFSTPCPRGGGSTKRPMLLWKILWVLTAPIALLTFLDTAEHLQRVRRGTPKRSWVVEDRLTAS